MSGTLAEIRRAAFIVACLIFTMVFTATVHSAVAADLASIAVPDVQALTPEIAEVAARETASFRRELLKENSLRVIEGPSMPAGYQDRLPPFALWREAHVDLFLAGYAKMVADRPVVQVRVWDVTTGREIVGQMYVSDSKQWPAIGDEIAREIRDRLMGALAKDSAPK
jgi:TolB-like protein